MSLKFFDQIFAQTPTIVNRPICPTFVHDDTTRLVIILTILPLSLLALYRIMRYYDGWWLGASQGLWESNFKWAINLLWISSLLSAKPIWALWARKWGLLKMKEFHRSFILELVFVGLVTMFGMVYAHICIPKLYSLAKKNQEYTSQKSQISVDVEEIKSIRPSLD